MVTREAREAGCDADPAISPRPPMLAPSVQHQVRTPLASVLSLYQHAFIQTSIANTFFGNI